jgi:hypothetical protein
MRNNDCFFDGAPRFSRERRGFDGRRFGPGRCWGLCLALGTLVATGSALGAGTGIAYGTIHNFDTVNDTGVACHGFEIELEDLGSRDLTYTFDYNHYGTPRIFEDTTSRPGRTNVVVRYAAAYANGAWSAYTAVPTGPIPPTQGHQFTNPGVNFGGEHFGVGFQRGPAAARYFWLIDDGSGNLIRGGEVLVSTPVFAYVPPAGGAPAQVQAVIEPPEPPEVPVREFGPAAWVKEIRTTTHNNREVRLRDLVSDDPDDADDKNWRNGEPDEVEVEWQLLQREFARPDGGENGRLEAAPEGLDKGDEVITRRYEFYEYVGPLDNETGEAKGSKVGPDDLHGKGIKEINGVEVDLSTVVVVGKYLGAQMSAFDAKLPVGLIDQVPNGEVGVVYPTRTLVIAGQTAFVAATAGVLPEGLVFDTEAGELSGTPAEAGEFVFTVTVTAEGLEAQQKTYAFVISPAGAPAAPGFSVDTVAAPLDGGTTTGSGVYELGEDAAVVANPAPGHRFVNWTDNGQAVSSATRYAFTPNVNRSLVAHFVRDAAAPPTLSIRQLDPAALLVSWSTNHTGFVLQRNLESSATGWTGVDAVPTVVGTEYQIRINPLTAAGFFRAVRP